MSCHGCHCCLAWQNAADEEAARWARERDSALLRLAQHVEHLLAQAQRGMPLDLVADLVRADPAVRNAQDRLLADLGGPA